MYISSLFFFDGIKAIFEIFVCFIVCCVGFSCLLSIHNLSCYINRSLVSLHFGVYYRYIQLKNAIAELLEVSYIYIGVNCMDAKRL